MKKNCRLPIADCRIAPPKRWRCCHHGFTLAESVMALLIVSIILVAAMRATGSSGLIQYKAAERTTGRFLATGLMNDIYQLSYQDPVTTPSFGPESGESTTSKAAWNDVDDFNGWSESPPQERDGTVMSNLSGWTRTVTIERVNPSNLSIVSATETGAKRIMVVVRHNAITIATRIAIRTNAP